LRSVADAEFVRRQNRALLLGALRREGPMSRTRIATVTGLSNASITGIGGELVKEQVLVELEMPVGAPGRGRPAVPVGFNRFAAYAAIVELDVNRVRLSLIDYAGNIVDRLEFPLEPDFFATHEPAAFLAERIEQLRRRDPSQMASLRAIAVSAQGILDRNADVLLWSPIAHVSGAGIVGPLSAAFGVPVKLYKRGPLLAEGTRALYPEFHDQPIAALFVGSTVAIGLSLPQGSTFDLGATEFGHMNHVPDGARCRCGMKGCIEAYAADYGVLRSAYGVPDQVPPAARVPATAYRELVSLARGGRRNAVHAFNTAGRALGYGIARLLTVVFPAHVVITGPGAEAYELMRAEMEAAFRDSLLCRIHGAPTISVLHDEREPIFQGLMAATLATLDEGFVARG
jgi:predicted NBD/HSP70 family sugar kinase